jgi:hypothetical protein
VEFVAAHWRLAAVAASFFAASRCDGRGSAGRPRGAAVGARGPRARACRERGAISVFLDALWIPLAVAAI